VAETTRCVGCELLEMERDNLPDSDRKGVRVFLVPNMRAE